MKTKEVIAEVSAKLFSVYGYEGTSLAMIAEEVGIKKPSLYAHYDSKEALFSAVLEQMTTKYRQFMHAAVEKTIGLPAEKRLFSFMETYVLELPKDETGVNFYNRFYTYPPAGLEETVREYMKAEDRMCKQFISELIDTGKEQLQIRKDLPTSQMSNTFLYIIDGLYYENNLYSDQEISKHMLEVWEMFWDNIMMNQYTK